jgi:hypothetical protein
VRYFGRFAETGRQGSGPRLIFAFGGGVYVREVYYSVLHPNDIIIE